MTREKWARLKSLFEQARDLPIGERPHFINQIYGSDNDLKASLDSLIEHYQTATSLLSGPIISQERIA